METTLWFEFELFFKTHFALKNKHHDQLNLHKTALIGGYRLEICEICENIVLKNVFLDLKIVSARGLGSY